VSYRKLLNCFRKRNVLNAVVLLGLIFFVVILSLSKGSVELSNEEIFKAFLRQGDPTNQIIFWELRLPRLIASLLVGSALGMSGALLQGMLRNGLASPYLLGISAGSGLVIVLLISMGLWLSWIPIAAWIGAICTTLIVYFLAKSGSSISVERLILAGVALSSLFGSVQSMLLLQTEDGRVQAALTWLIGSLNSRGWNEINLAGPPIVFALVMGLLLSRQLNLLGLGDELSVGLGNSLFRSRCLIGASATLLAASSVSVGGLIGFVGLIVPHAVRFLFGTDYRIVLPFSALLGAFTLSAADLIARSGSIELPVGIITSLTGAPIFIFLLYRRQKTLTNLR
tara:strand:- start:167 stop:1186 length:1020 start_codon:yes stop_codon:yes gene_type:complete